MCWIIITGNVIDGFNHYGPFSSAELAAQWAATNKKGEHWHAVSLMDP